MVDEVWSGGSARSSCLFVVSCGWSSQRGKAKARKAMMRGACDKQKAGSAAAQPPAASPNARLSQLSAGVVLYGVSALVRLCACPSLPPPSLSRCAVAPCSPGLLARLPPSPLASLPPNQTKPLGAGSPTTPPNSSLARRAVVARLVQCTPHAIVVVNPWTRRRERAGRQATEFIMVIMGRRRGGGGEPHGDQRDAKAQSSTGVKGRRSQDRRVSFNWKLLLASASRDDDGLPAKNDNEQGRERE